MKSCLSFPNSERVSVRLEVLRITEAFNTKCLVHMGWSICLTSVGTVFARIRETHVAQNSIAVGTMLKYNRLAQYLNIT